MNNKTSGLKIEKIIGLIVASFAVILIFNGCTAKNIQEKIQDYFNKEASMEEETASIADENVIFPAQVMDAEARSLKKANGEPVTIYVALETATGGEPRINSDGELETYPLGEMVTYAPGSPVFNSDGTKETYAGGEIATDVLGIPYVDKNGEIIKRVEGEVVTHGSDDVVLDAAGNKMRYSGEHMTYAFGDPKYTKEGERVTHPVMIRTDALGEPVTGSDGKPLLDAIELVTDSSGNPIIEDNGEAATKQLNPLPPERIIDTPLEEGIYYINNIISEFFCFATPYVNAADVPVVVDENTDSAKYEVPDTAGKINNLQLERLGASVKSLELKTDAEGYAYFVSPENGKLLTLNGDLRNGVNIVLKDMVNTPYPQYKYHDNPIYYTVADNQKWVIKENSEGSFVICSYINQDYVMTVDDQNGLTNASIVLWKNDGRDQQKFEFRTDAPKIEKCIEEGTYVFRSGISDAMLISLGDDNYEDERLAYVFFSDFGNGQMIRIKYDEFGYAYLFHGDSNKALSVYGNEARNDAQIIQYEFDGNDWQKWIISPAPHGGYYIRSALNTSEVMDVAEETTRCGNSVILNFNSDAYSQNWFIENATVPSPYNLSMDECAQYFGSETEYLILVNSNASTVKVYYGSQGNWENIKTYSCVAGKSSTPTVRGEFSIYQKLEYFDGNMDSPAWYTCYYASGFYPQYFFHSIIYYQGTWDIMDASMGFNASHGCVRLYTENAQWIYENIPYGTKVVSY